MYTLFVVELSQPMLDFVDDSATFGFTAIETLSPENNLRISKHVSSVAPSGRRRPTGIDLTFTLIQSILSESTHVKTSPDDIVFAASTCDSGLVTASSLPEFREQLVTLSRTSLPPKFSLLETLGAINSVLGSVRNHVDVIIFCSSPLSETSQKLAPPDQILPCPLANNASLNFVTVQRMNEPYQTPSVDFLSRLIKLNGSSGQIFTFPSENGAESMVEKIRAAFLSPSLSSIKFGVLTGRVRLLPRPTEASTGTTFPEEIVVLGCVERASIEKLLPSQMYIVSPWPNTEKTDVLMEPHLAPLFHASLKLMPGKVALVSLGTDWSGYLETSEDARTKRKSTLVLHVFPQGFPISTNGQPVIEHLSPVDPEDRPSYTNPSFLASWTSAEALQSDFSRIIRMARKLPDKLEAFFKEVNKVRLHALSTSNFQLLELLADVLQRELQVAPVGAHDAMRTVLAKLRVSSKADLFSSLVTSDGKEYPLY